jgi:hypothetical protein
MDYEMKPTDKLLRIQPCQIYEQIGEYEKTANSRTYIDMIPIIELDRNVFTEEYKLEEQLLCKRVQLCKICINNLLDNMK